MAGMETRKRGHEVPLKANYMIGGVKTTNYVVDGLNTRQETTSYRTHGLQDRGENPLDLSVTYNAFRDTYPEKDQHGNLYDNGHEFFTKKTWDKLSHPQYYTKNPLGGNWWSGPLALNNIGEAMSLPAFSKMSANDIKFWGTKAIALTAPTQPAANTSQMIAELLSEGLPFGSSAISALHQRFDYFHRYGAGQILLNTGKKGGKDLKGLSWRDYATVVGDSALGVQFGVKPLVNDLVAILTAISNSSKIIEQFIRDSGRQVRRSITLSRTNSTTQPRPLSGGPFLSGLTYGGPADVFKRQAGSVIFTQSATELIRFKGAYVYYVNKDDFALRNIIGQGRLADKLLGTRVSWDTLWQLMPYSWLIDWKFNVGDSISNWRRLSSDSLVLRYGYITRKITIFNSYTAQGYEFFDSNPGTVYRQYALTAHERYKATPYGFGLDPNGFSVNQTSILAALGLTKGGKYIP